MLSHPKDILSFTNIFIFFDIRLCKYVYMPKINLCTCTFDFIYASVYLPGSSVRPARSGLCRTLLGLQVAPAAAEYAIIRSAVPNDDVYLNRLQCESYKTLYSI